MPQPNLDNPPRRAKAVPILPKPSLTPPSPMSSDDDYGPPVQAVRRGRKPGTMSRTAREAQRKLNHSIIEKARRTKINDALATLRTLVPDEFVVEEDEDKEEGKKADKEKEFKLEILVRTVGYMQFLVDRVKQLEAQGKRKMDADLEDEVAPRGKKRQRRPDLEAQENQNNERLPSISSWLDQLPTPPSSSTFSPVSQLCRHPPALSLGPVDDDHSAATLLLHMSSRVRSSSAREEDKFAPLTPSAMLGMSTKQ